MSTIRLVSSPPAQVTSPAVDQAAKDHQFLLEGYLRSHRIRNHAATTLSRERSFLEGWFVSHGSADRPLYTWEAMRPVIGRQLIADYANAIVETGVAAETVRAYVGILNRYFAYVLEHAFISTPEGIRHIPAIYGPIDQPVSEYDLPQHVYDGEKAGVPMDPEKLYEFFAVLRKSYLGVAGTQHAIRARNYTLAVVAGECGLRVDELMHLDTRYDLFFNSKKLQTRYGKGTNGSGKRPRLTLFPPLARDTVSYYLKEHLPKISKARAITHLFPSNRGNILTYTSLHEALEEMLHVARKANFPVAPHMSWHWFRRFFATRFIERFPQRMDVLISLLGHMSPNTVHRYIRHSEAWMDRQMQSVIEGEATIWQSNGD